MMNKYQEALERIKENFCVMCDEYLIKGGKCDCPFLDDVDTLQELVNKYTELNNVYHEHEPMETADLNAKRLEKHYKEVEPFINKATPKKVILHYKHHLGTAWGTFVSRITCPSCNRRLKDKIPNNQTLCPRCGQALDWSSNND